MSARSRIRDLVHVEAGTTLVQLMISSALTAVVVGGAFSMANSVQTSWDRTRPLLEAGQVGRIVVERMQRDLHRTGVGIAWLLPPLPLIVPRPDGGIEIRHNEAGITRSLVAAMANTTADVEVGDVIGFQPGQRVVIFDADGSLDIITITDMDVAANTLSHAGVSKAYGPADGASVALLESISYWAEVVNGVPKLMRSVNGGSGQVVAENIQSFAVTYLNDASPSAPFAPVSEPEMLRILGVELVLELRAESPSLGAPRIVRFDARVSPRGLVLS